MDTELIGGKHDSEAPSTPGGLGVKIALGAIGVAALGVGIYAATRSKKDDAQATAPGAAPDTTAVPAQAPAPSAAPRAPAAPGAHPAARAHAVPTAPPGAPPAASTPSGVAVPLPGTMSGVAVAPQGTLSGMPAPVPAQVGSAISALAGLAPGLGGIPGLGG